MRDDYRIFNFDSFVDEWVKGSAVTKRFGYRTARMDGVFCTYQDESFPYSDSFARDYRKLHSLLADMSPVVEGRKGYADNHDAYELTSGQSGRSLYVFFSDWKIYLCNGYAPSREG